MTREYNVSIHESVQRACRKLNELQYENGRWQGIINFGSYSTSLALFLSRLVEGKTNEWHRKTASWIVAQQKSNGSWGTAWSNYSYIESDMEKLLVEQIRRNTKTAAIALQLVDGFDNTIKSAREWLKYNDYGDNDPLDQLLEAIVGIKGWNQMKIGDYIKLLAVDLTKILPAWMVDLVAGVTLAASSLGQESKFPLAKIVEKKIERLLHARQLEDGSWFCTVDNTVYACLGLSSKSQGQQIKRNVLKFIRQKQTSSNMIQRFSIPIWDTARSLLALKEAGYTKDVLFVKKGIKYLQLTSDDDKWSFSPEANRYPDCDDTALAFLALKSYNAVDEDHKSLHWLLEMQNDDGGWASFLHNHKSLIKGRLDFEDQSTPDVTAHVLEALAAAGYTHSHTTVDNAIKYLEDSQLSDGSWYGRWGLCFIYGTSQVLESFQSLGLQTRQSCLKAVKWLKNIENEDGGWGEHPISYYRDHYIATERSFPSQTSWAIHGILSEKNPSNDILIRAVNFLLDSQISGGTWPSFPTSAALEIYENSIDALILPISALARAIKYMN